MWDCVQQPIGECWVMADTVVTLKAICGEKDYCLDLVLFPSSDLPGAISMSPQSMTVPCHLHACVNWRWRPITPLTSTETCEYVSTEDCEWT